mgnify:CR=1 FL=1
MTEPKYAHIIFTEDQMRGYVNGEEVEALCGHTFIPTRDPEAFPNCPKCDFLAKSILIIQMHD